jgi:alkylated DNA nucleotide flippase Atl1
MRATQQLQVSTVDALPEGAAASTVIVGKNDSARQVVGVVGHLFGMDDQAAWIRLIQDDRVRYVDRSLFEETIEDSDKYGEADGILPGESTRISLRKVRCPVVDCPRRVSWTAISPTRELRCSIHDEVLEEFDG